MGSADTRLELVFGGRPTSDRMALRVLIANCQPIVRHGLRALIVREPDADLILLAARTLSGRLVPWLQNQ